MTTSLDRLNVGQKATIANISVQGPFKQRLQEMGVVRGTPVELVRLAPLGDPLEIRIRGYSLSLRKQEAQGIEVNVQS